MQSAARFRTGWLPVAVAACLFGLSACGGAPATPDRAASASSPASTTVLAASSASGTALTPKYFLYVPPSLSGSGPVRLMVALHGMGGNGSDFAKPFVRLAQTHGWLLAAPTFAYADWRNPDVVRSDDVTFCRQLQAMVTDVARQTGREVRPELFLLGFSRGAQLADRFAFFHPEQVAAVASLSAGTYTMPENAADLDGDGKLDTLPLPFGTADMQRWFGHSLDVRQLRQVPFWLSVGGADTNPNDLPRQWDALLGRTRVARAEAFEHALELVKVPVQLTVYPRAAHQLTPAMADGVGAFLSRI